MGRGRRKSGPKLAQNTIFCAQATVVRRVEAAVLESHERMMHLVCWGLPAVFMFLPFLSEGYTGSGTWCWISNGEC